MKAIAAVSTDWAIGKDNSLLFSIPEDMKYFRAATKGNVVVMGRKTLESFPGGKPLPYRMNIVLTGNREYDAKGAAVVCSVEELLELLKNYDTENVFVIGGGKIYKELLPWIDTALITKVEEHRPADTFFPNLDLDHDWEIADCSGEKEHEGIRFRFVTYQRKGKKHESHNEDN